MVKVGDKVIITGVGTMYKGIIHGLAISSEATVESVWKDGMIHARGVDKEGKSIVQAVSNGHYRKKDADKLELIANLSAEVVRLSKRIDTLEQMLTPRNDPQDRAKPLVGLKTILDEWKAKTIKLTREEIIEKAKVDIVGLKNSKRKDIGGEYVVRSFATKAEYIVNKEKRTVVVLLRGAGEGSIYAKGIAKCAPDDCFNVHIGKAIALRRALGLEVPKEYVKAPQPKEAKVGDVIIGARDGKERRVVKFRKSMGETELYSLNCKGARVIDDSDRITTL